MSVRMVTGYTGQGHVTAADAGLFNAGIVGEGRYVLETSDRLDAEIVTNNQIKIKAGDICNQGRQISIPPNTYETVAIDNGSQGKNRIDAIVMRYLKDAVSGVETASLVVIKGTESTTTPSAPSITTGDIFAGERQDDFLLYLVDIEGLQITGLRKQFTVRKSLESVEARIPIAINENMTTVLNAVYPVGSIYMSVGTASPAALFGGTWEKIEGRFLLGSGAGYNNGATGGEAAHTLTAAESGLPAHGHGFTQPTVNGGSCNTTNSGSCNTTSSGSCNTSSAGAHDHMPLEMRYSKDAATGTAKARLAGNGTTVETRDENNSPIILPEDGTHFHSVPNHVHGVPNHVHGVPNHTHTVSGGAVQNHSGAGASQSHNNMPPYLVVNVWKRTA